MKNNTIDRKLVLDAMIRHETLTFTDLAKKENLGVLPDTTHLKYLLEELSGSGHLQDIPGAPLLTYTITEKGIEEGVRLRQAGEEPVAGSCSPGGCTKQE